MLNRNTWNQLTVCKQITYNESFKNKVTNKWFFHKSIVQRLKWYKKNNLAQSVVAVEYTDFSAEG